MIKSKKLGFSLVEVLVGGVIVIVASTVVLSIIISSFRISTKTTTNSILRQNGNYALSQISRTIQFADSFTNVKRGNTTYTDCINTTYSSLSEINVVYNNTPTSILCNGDQILINGTSSIDRTKVRVTSCSFTCSQRSDEGPEIGIKFNISTVGSSTPESSSSLNFSTAVKMRNL